MSSVPPRRSTPGRSAPASLKVRTKSRTVEQFAAQFSGDTTYDGVFLKTDKPLLAGTLVRLELQLRSGEPMIRGVGRVAWRRVAPHGDLPAGMGVAFLKLDALSRTRVARLVALRGLAISRFEDSEGAEQAPPLEAPPSLVAGVTPQAASATASGPVAAGSPSQPTGLFSAVGGVFSAAPSVPQDPPPPRSPRGMFEREQDGLQQDGPQQDGLAPGALAPESPTGSPDWAPAGPKSRPRARRSRGPLVGRAARSSKPTKRAETLPDTTLTPLSRLSEDPSGGERKARGDQTRSRVPQPAGSARSRSARPGLGADDAFTQALEPALSFDDTTNPGIGALAPPPGAAASGGASPTARPAVRAATTAPPPSQMAGRHAAASAVSTAPGRQRTSGVSRLAPPQPAGLVDAPPSPSAPEGQGAEESERAGPPPADRLYADEGPPPESPGGGGAGRRRGSRWLIAFAMLVLAALGAYWWWQTRQASPAPEGAPAAVSEPIPGEPIPGEPSPGETDQATDPSPSTAPSPDLPVAPSATPSAAATDTGPVPLAAPPEAEGDARPDLGLEQARPAGSEAPGVKPSRYRLEVRASPRARLIVLGKRYTTPADIDLDNVSESFYVSAARVGYRQTGRQVRPADFKLRQGRFRHRLWIQLERLPRPAESGSDPVPDPDPDPDPDPSAAVSNPSSTGPATTEPAAHGAPSASETSPPQESATASALPAAPAGPAPASL